MNTAYDHLIIQIWLSIRLNRSRDAYDKLPPLRFAVGDEVEFLHELETGSEWKLGKVIELHYREQDFILNFSSPYRLQLLDSKVEPSEYAWVKADLDRYVRKVGIRSIEDTRYQARLDAKVTELAQVYCSKVFVQDIHRILAQDHEFVEMVRSVWEIELSEAAIRYYRKLVMMREPFVQTDSGYHVPTYEEVIAGIKAYFDPAHLSVDAPASAVGDDRYAQQIRNAILNFIPLCTNSRCPRGGSSDLTADGNAQGLLLHCIMGCMPLTVNAALNIDFPGTIDELLDQYFDLNIPAMMAEAISKVSTSHDLRVIRSDSTWPDRLDHYMLVWLEVQMCLENPNAGSACECPFIYFFVKYCLDYKMGVPKLALALYDRMNTQLSREFIRCANPTCEHNKLDKSTGKVKFKKCSRCQAVIYCSRECQVAHYPDHKRLCLKHSCRKGS